MPDYAVTPASLYATLKIVFGANATGATDRQTLLVNAIQAAYAYVWYYAPWRFRVLHATVATAKDQAYSTLPDDYCREESLGDWLVDATRDKRPQYVTPEQLEALGADTEQTSGDPEYFTVIDTAITAGTPPVTTYTPTIKWKPTPASAITYSGLLYARKAPAVTTSTTDAVFPTVAFDLIFEAAAKALAARDLVPNEGLRIPTLAEVTAMLETAKGRFACAPRPRHWRDTAGWLEDFQIYADNTPELNAAGVRLLGGL